ncbi:4a-hydroxytetrahydrobiopterin dehydratase [Candidatus Nomurabacteria bacterium]|nr:4a-hydroxytetrahydrobiopterin dehydratase [Candidatus Kaiserbacteria bacterium]MCB9811128.1 4a-hydroxytetrahydrobiopterin dehydratase [Candidatus Nomurabacteria bacterium]MCB9814436.1 4a-hydroxytetrahydrobiopterin dehydratase [Candidatus Nomurabacteria bacterium]
MSKHTILGETAIQQLLLDLPDWKVIENKITAEFVFRTFADAIKFINNVATVAEEMNHHPEFCSSYNKVRFSYCTHDVGDKITDSDLKIAKQISELARNLNGKSGY